MYKVEFHANSLKTAEFTIGIHGCYGEDENGPFYMFTLGMFFFDVCILSYKE